MTTYTGTDTAGREWTGEREGDQINWTSNDGLQGTETVEGGGDNMHGTDATGDVVPCDYDGSTWEGDCPSGDYEETE